MSYLNGFISKLVKLLTKPLRRKVFYVKYNYFYWVYCPRVQLGDYFIFFFHISQISSDTLHLNWSWNLQRVQCSKTCDLAFIIWSKQCQRNEISLVESVTGAISDISIRHRHGIPRTDLYFQISSYNIMPR